MVDMRRYKRLLQASCGTSVIRDKSLGDFRGSLAGYGEKESKRKHVKVQYLEIAETPDWVC
jgi:hypothetical protein